MPRQRAADWRTITRAGAGPDRGRFAAGESNLLLRGACFAIEPNQAKSGGTPLFAGGTVLLLLPQGSRMRQPAVIESIEKRQLYSASPATNVVHVGPSSGLHAAAVTRNFGQLLTVSNANPTNPNAAADLDTAIKLTILPVDGRGGIDAQSAHLVRAAVRLTNLTTGKVYRSNDPGSELRRLKTSGGGDVLTIQTDDPLDANTTYRVEVNGTFVDTNNKVRDVMGAFFNSFTGTFTTGTYLPTAEPSINFTQVAPGRHRYAAVRRHHDRARPQALRVDHRRLHLPLHDRDGRHAVGRAGNRHGPHQQRRPADHHRHHLRPRLVPAGRAAGAVGSATTSTASATTPAAATRCSCMPRISPARSASSAGRTWRTTRTRSWASRGRSKTT